MASLSLRVSRAARRTAVLLLAASLAAVSATPAFAQRSATRLLFPPHSHPYGQSFAEWSGDYQVWLNEIPLDRNPVDPASPENCAPQGRHVVFLGPNGADCRIPSGRSVAFTVVFWECSTAEGLGETFAELRRCAKENWHNDFNAEVFKLRMSIDGRPLPKWHRWIYVTPGEIIDFPEENLWGAPPGPSKSVTKSPFWMLRPLRAGDHLISVHVEHEVFGEIDWDYKLHVG